MNRETESLSTTVTADNSSGPLSQAPRTVTHKAYPCGKCGKNFKQSYNMLRHQIRCGFNRQRSQRTKTARKNHSRDPATNAIIIESAFNRHLITYFIENTYDAEEIDTFFTMAFQTIIDLIKRHLDDWNSVVVNFSLETFHVIPEKKEDPVERNFKTKSFQILQETDIEEAIVDGIQKISTEMEEYEGKGSGYTLCSIEGVLLNISKYNPLKAGCYQPLPEWIRKTQAVDNSLHDPKANKCFMLAILAGGNKEQQYDFSRITYPTPLKDIGKFEEDNDGVAINIFALDEKNKIYPLRVSQVGNVRENLDLLLLKNNSDDNHFVRIINFEKLIRAQLTKHTDSIVICRRCFTHYDGRYGSKEDRLRQHMKYGCMDTPAIAKVPSNDRNILSFNHHRYKLRLPFVIYADIECILTPIDTCLPNGSFINKYQKHEAMACSIFVKADVEINDPDFNRAWTYTGNDAICKLMKRLMEIAIKVWNIYARNTPPKLSIEEWSQWYRADTCHFCSKGFVDPKDGKVLDHDHITGAYRGASHNSCNLLAKTPIFIPVLFHNGSGYDYKFLVRELGKWPGDISVIPNNQEKFISFSKQVIIPAPEEEEEEEQEEEEEVEYSTTTKKKKYIWLRFLDSFRFLQASLDSVVQTLERDDFNILPTFYQGRKLELLMKKGVFPYEYVSSWSRLEDKALPPKEQFASSLSESTITDYEYAHAQEVWKTFEIDNLQRYMELYLETDVYLLAEVFEKFRREFLCSEYAIDPAYYFTIPGLAYDGMLKITNVELELLTDYDMIIMFERGIRGGLTQVSRRHAKANEDNAIIYIDANNLYGAGSVCFLPKRDFQWIDPETIDLLTVPENSEIGYIAEVDIEIPEHVHDLFNAYPPLPEKEIPPGSKFPKLLATLTNKKNYVIHYRVLQFVVSHGCRLTSVHRVIRFQQSPWLEPFISINNEKRKIAKNEFAKQLWKLTNNANYGKTVECVRKRINLRMVTEWSMAEKLISQPSYMSHIIYDENLVAILRRRMEIFFNKPLYAGFVILEMAKLKMLQFYYDEMLRHYGPERLDLLYTDTDSYVFLIKLRQSGEDWRIEANMYLSDFFDFSNLPSNHPVYSTVNKGVLMKFKDEAAGKKIVEWVGLRSKMYAIRFDDDDKGEIKKAKGIKKTAVKKRLSFNDFMIALKEKKTFISTFAAIRSFKQILYTVQISKVSLCPNDDKRHICQDGITTKAYGHYAIMDIL